MVKTIVISLFLVLSTVSLWAKKSKVEQDSVNTKKLSRVVQREIRRSRELDTTNKKLMDIVVDNIHDDTFSYKLFLSEIDTSNRFYGISKLVSNILVTNQNKPEIMESNRIYERFNGYTVDSIFFVRTPPFEVSPTSKRFEAWVEGAANTLHTITRENVIRKNLLFKKGSKIDATILERNEYLLRNLGFISNAYFILERIGDNKVNVYVCTKDNFTLSVGVDFHGINNNSSAWISEANFLGRGNTLTVTDHFNIGDRNFTRAGDISHRFTNLFGTFFELTTSLGYGQQYFLGEVTALKNFIKPKDYAGGAYYYRNRDYQDFTLIDTNMNVDKQRYGLWGGYSFQLGKTQNAVYFTVKGERNTFFRRPYTTLYYNPAFHNNTQLLTSVGIYAERFYRGNLIYGFGNIENIPYGYKVEATGGYLWSDYNRTPYLGAEIRYGYKTLFGYVNSGIKSGTIFYNNKGTPQTIININTLYFSHLINLKKGFNIRQFLSLDYTVGINMLSGERQRLFFGGATPLRGVGTPNIYGTTRMYISPETVLFTPYHLWGFRFALYGYVDMGTLGYKHNPFANPFYSALGFGVRIRNENLVFKTIQIRLSVALNKHAITSPDMFRVTGESYLRSPRFIPREPTVIQY